MTKLYTRSLEPVNTLIWIQQKDEPLKEEYPSFHSNFPSFYLIYLSAFHSTPAEAAAVLTLKRTKSLSNSRWIVFILVCEVLNLKTCCLLDNYCQMSENIRTFTSGRDGERKFNVANVVLLDTSSRELSWKLCLFGIHQPLIKQ